MCLTPVPYRGIVPLYERNSHLPLQIHRLYLRRLRLHPSGRLHMRSPRLHLQRLIPMPFGQDLDSPGRGLGLFHGITQSSGSPDLQNRWLHLIG